MNGGGKLWADPSGSSDFVGKTGDSIHLTFASSGGVIRVLSASYAGQMLLVENESVSFIVVAGYAGLTLSFATATTDEEVGVFQETAQGALAALTYLRLRATAPIVEFRILGIH